MNSVNLKNRVAVITGGLGGIGRAVVFELIRAGAKCAVIDSRHAKKSELIKIFQGKEIFFLPADVKSEAGLKKAFGKVQSKYKRVDILVNCAGVIGPIGPTHKVDLSEWEKAFSINLEGTVNACHAVLPFMLKARSGKIINLAGGGAVEPMPNFSAYASSKAAVVRFTENLAKEYSKSGIEINAVSPGRIITQLLDELLGAGPKRVGIKYYKEVLKDKKKGADSVERAAELIVFLCSPNNRLTGKLISAKWDNWQKLSSKDINHLNQSSEFTLRRIDNKYFYEK